MPTIDASRVGYIVGTGGSSFATSRTANGSTAFDSPTGDQNSPIQTFYSSGRGGGTYRQTRAYFYFDTSGISNLSTVTSATLKVTSTSLSAGTTGNAIAMNGFNAFGGNGNTALDVGDFDEVGMGGTSEEFSSQFTPWPASTQQLISLNSNAFSALASDDDTVICLMNYVNDQQNSAPTTSPWTKSCSIAFSTKIKLDYSTTPLTNISKVDGVVYNVSNINKFNGTLFNNIDAINGVT